MRHAIETVLIAFQDFLALAGIKADLNILWIVFWCGTGLAAVLVLKKVITAVVSATPHVRRGLAGYAASQPWKNLGTVTTLTGFAAFLIAYGFYGREQTRTFGQALSDLVAEQLASLAPLAVLTQFILLVLLWIILGLLISLPWREVVTPVAVILGFAAFGAAFMLLPLGISLLARGSTVPGVLALLGIVAALYYMYVTDALLKNKNWRRPVGIGTFIPVLLVTSGLSAAVMGGTALYYLAAYSRLPVLAEILRIELVVTSGLFLIMCAIFRGKSYQDEYPVSRELFYFIDISLAIAAAIVALTGLPGSAVTLGWVPPWLVAIGPSLAVVALIVLLDLRHARARIPRWRLAVGACVALGLITWPLKLLLTEGLAPAIDLVFA